MDVVSEIVVPVVHALMISIKQKLRNLTSSADLVKEMRDKMELLDGQRIDNENHLRRNRENNKEIPSRVWGWLEEVEDIKKEIEKIPSNDIGCFNVKKKYRAGKNALMHIKDIERLSNENITWTDAYIPLGRVERPPSTSTSGGNTQNLFDSRVKPFNDALKLLQEDDDAARVIALCGMGGVGKTILMKQLKEAAEDNKMFNWIMVVTVGKTSNLFAIQNAIAEHICKSLTETDEKLRAAYLSKRFKELLKGKEKILVILDDVWEKIKVEDIGLASPLPNGVKLLLTSRDVNVCQQIADDAGSVLKVVGVDVLEEGEARDFFFRIPGISANDYDFYQIGCDIVKICGGLPLAIILIAAKLKCQDKIEWKRLKKNDLDMNVQNIFKMSYDNLKREEDKAIFLLCGMFPKDSNIPIEDLTRYAWGLKLLTQVSTMEDARYSIKTSLSNLKNANLLMDGDSHHSDFVKLHVLVHAFVLNTVSKGGEEGCWIIHHEDDFSNWSGGNDMSQSCKRISLTCKGVSEFPREFKFPNLTVLKLTQGDESLMFPQGFYEGMKELQVIAFEKLKNPLVPTSQFSSDLRTLCLEECELIDLTCIGNLSNLEVLSIANSGVTILPSTFRNLKKLRLLDVTGCCNLVIDDGVLKGLVKLEELYMIPKDEKTCCFTDNNNSEFAERSKNLCALEFEFIGNNAHMKNMYCKKLKRFKLSVGCSFTEVRNALLTRQVDTHSYENSLKLITNREELELLKFMMNELFRITDALYLQVNDMNTLPYSLFSNLRLLVVSQCTELKYLFTPMVATNLSKLEYLDISGCPNMEAVIHTENEGLLFSNLKYLRLAELPKLLYFCNKLDVIELSRLMELQLEGLPKFTLEDVVVAPPHPQHPPQNSPFYNLRLLVVSQCAELKYLFTSSVATNLSKLEYLDISGCPNMEAVIHTENEGLLFSNLKYLRLAELPKLLHFCNKVDVIELSRLMELQLEGLPNFTSIYPDSETSSVSSTYLEGLPKFNLQDATPKLTTKLEKLFVKDCDSIEVLFNMDFREIEQFSSGLRSIKVDGCNSLVKLFSCNPFPFFNNLQELTVRKCRSMEVLFDIDSGCTGNIGEQVCTSSSLRSIVVEECDSLVNLLPRNPVPLFNDLEELRVTQCASIEVIFDIDMTCVGETERVSSSRLRSISLWGLGKLREVWRIKDAGNNLIHGFEAVESIFIRDCDRFENLITPGTNIDLRKEVVAAAEKERKAMK